MKKPFATTAALGLFALVTACAVYKSPTPEEMYGPATTRDRVEAPKHDSNDQPPTTDTPSDRVETPPRDLPPELIGPDGIPPPPEMVPPPEVEYPKDEPPMEDPTEDPRIFEDPDDVNEDPSDSPNRDLAPDPSEYPGSESPHPLRGPSSALGLGGGIGGGGGRDQGGFEHRRARGATVNLQRIRAALDWLRDHQHKDGYWSAEGFSDSTRREAARKSYNAEFVDPGKIGADKGWSGSVDVGVTGLALLAFASAGHCHTEGDYKSSVRGGVMYLRKQQSADGCIGPKEDDHFVYNHAICTAALAEIYGLSKSPLLKSSVENAVKFILDAQNPGVGWRYGVRTGQSDTSVTAWMVGALYSAKLAGVEADYATAFQGAGKWLDAMTAELRGVPRTGYNEPAGNNSRLRSAQDYETNASMDAANIYLRLVTKAEGYDPRNRDLRAQAQACLTAQPTWEHYKIDYYYWYYGTLAMFQMGGADWTKWEKSMSKTLLDHQRGFSTADAGQTADTLDEHGSWDSVDAWGASGGRVYATALNCMTLGAATRYQRVHDKDRDK